MAASRKGMRSLVVGPSRYFWRAKGSDNGITVAITTDGSFVSGQHGQWLHLVVPYNSMSAAHRDSWSLHQRASVQPGLIRRFIEAAQTRTPPFTGRDGDQDIRLDDTEVAAILAQPPDVFLAEELKRASDALNAVIDRGTEHAPNTVEVLLGYFSSIGCLLASNDGPALRAAVNGWFSAHERRLNDAASILHAALNALQHEVRVPSQAWEAKWERLCQRRSGFESLFELGRAARSTTVMNLDTKALDAELRKRGANEKYVRPRPEIPPSHLWWSWAPKA